MFQSIKSKLNLLLSLLIVFTVILSLIMTNWIVENSQRNSVLENLKRTEQVVRTLLESQRLHLINESRLVGILPILTIIVEDGDPATILHTSKIYQKQLELHIMDIMDEEGEFLVGVEEQFGSEANPQIDYLKEQVLEEGHVRASLTVRQKKLALLAAAPVGLPEEPSGVLIVGQYLDDDFANKVKNLTKSHISFLIDQQIVGSSLPLIDQSTLLEALQTHLSKTKSPESSLVLDIETHLLQIESLEDIHGKDIGQLIIQFSLEETKSILQNIRFLLLAIGTGVFFVAIVVGYLFTGKTIVTPIKILQETAVQLAQGNLDQQIDVTRKDELGSLAKSFAVMRDAVHKKIQDLQVLNETGAILAGLSDQIMALETALRIMQEKTHVEWGSVYLINEEGNLQIKAYYPSLEQAPEKPPKHFQPGEGIAGKSAEQKKIIYIPDTSKSSEYVKEYGDEKPKALLCIPLLDDQEVFGMMNFSGEVGKVMFDLVDEEFAQTVVQMTMATYKNIENQQLAIENLKKADKLKDEFLANTSHELRTPLNGIIGLAESLVDGIGGSVTPIQNQNLNMIIQSGKRLSNLINDILDFSKMKTQELQLQLKPLEIKSIVDVVLALSKPLIGQKSVELHNTIPDSLPLVTADENRLQQILLNLVGNSIKFTHQGNVTITGVQEETHILISISDTGIGIPQDKQDRIFQSFEQAEGSTAREYGGTGLGLSITKQLVELHGGTIKVESTEGVGSSFSFRLPIDEHQSVQGEQLHQHSLEAQESQIEIYAEINENDLSQPSEIVVPREQGKTILVVDDEFVNVQVLKNHLSLKNYHVLTAQDGFLALDILKREQPDLILLDLMMPRISGFEVCQKIRESFDASTLPIVMLTAKNQTNDLLQGMDNGANDYLVKPFNKEELLARIKNHLSLSQTNRAYERFVPNEYLALLNKENIVDVKLGDHQQRNMSILFSDIRSFTTLSENMSPEETFKFLNAYLRRMGPIVREHDGFIDKYIGDAIMALFNNKADDALKAAIVMLQNLAVYNKERLKIGFLPIHIGIGINTGELILGTLGEHNRMEGSVISDAVNVASRIEGLTKIYGVPLLISEYTFNELNDPNEYAIRFIDRVQVKGKSKMLTVYEVFDHEPPKIKESKLAIKKEFEKAWLLYQSKEFDKALKLFQRCLDQAPDDTVIQVYIKRCQQMPI